MCYDVEDVAFANESWLIPLLRRQGRSRAPNAVWVEGVLESCVLTAVNPCPHEVLLMHRCPSRNLL